jgi:hypothetical protein
MKKPNSGFRSVRQLCCTKNQDLTAHARRRARPTCTQLNRGAPRPCETGSNRHPDLKVGHHMLIYGHASALLAMFRLSSACARKHTASWLPHMKPFKKLSMNQT